MGPEGRVGSIPRGRDPPQTPPRGLRLHQKRTSLAQALFPLSLDPALLVYSIILIFDYMAPPWGSAGESVVLAASPRLHQCFQRPRKNNQKTNDRLVPFLINFGSIWDPFSHPFFIFVQPGAKQANL